MLSFCPVYTYVCIPVITTTWGPDRVPSGVFLSAGGPYSHWGPVQLGLASAGCSVLDLHLNPIVSDQIYADAQQCFFFFFLTDFLFSFAVSSSLTVLVLIVSHPLLFSWLSPITHFPSTLVCQGRTFIWYGFHACHEVLAHYSDNTFNHWYIYCKLRTMGT